MNIAGAHPVVAKRKLVKLRLRMQERISVQPWFCDPLCEVAQDRALHFLTSAGPYYLATVNMLCCKVGGSFFKIVLLQYTKPALFVQERDLKFSIA